MEQNSLGVLMEQANMRREVCVFNSGAALEWLSPLWPRSSANAFVVYYIISSYS